MLLFLVLIHRKDLKQSLPTTHSLQQSITGGKGDFPRDKEWHLNHPSQSKPSLKTMFKNVEHFRLLQISSFQIFSLLFFSLLVWLAENQHVACHTQTAERRQEAMSCGMPHQSQISRFFWIKKFNTLARTTWFSLLCFIFNIVHHYSMLPVFRWPNFWLSAWVS